MAQRKPSAQRITKPRNNSTWRLLLATYRPRARPVATTTQKQKRHIVRSCAQRYSASIKKCAAYPTPRRTGQNSVRRTLRRIELTKKVCGVPYAAKNWPKKCAAYPTPHRTDRNSVRRRVRRTLHFTFSLLLHAPTTLTADYLP